MNIIEQKLKIPAIIMIVIAVISILMNLVGIATNLLSSGAGIADQIADPQMKQFATIMAGGQGIMGVIMGIFMLGLNGFVIFGSIKMMKGESYGLAMAASIIYVIPCFSFCCLGMPFGIWALVLLMNDEVKAAFSQNETTPGVSNDSNSGNMV